MALIVVIDDEPVLRQNLARFLRGLGHEIQTASNGREAIVIVRDVRPDLIITDINMPDMDGIEILNALRDEESPVPVIAISAGGLFPKALLLDSADQLGAVVTLAKPFELKDLGRAVEQVLG